MLLPLYNPIGTNPCLAREGEPSFPFHLQPHSIGRALLIQKACMIKRLEIVVQDRVLFPAAGGEDRRRRRYTHSQDHPKCAGLSEVRWKRNAESDIASEPSDDDIAAPAIEASAEGSTKCAATAFLRSIELHQDQVDGEHERRHQPSSHQPTAARGSISRKCNRAHVWSPGRGESARPLYTRADPWSPNRVYVGDDRDRAAAQL